MFGKILDQPRLVCYYADNGKNYKYSQTKLIGQWWDLELDKLRIYINSIFWLSINSVLCNLYRDNHDSMWRHSDDEPELWPDPIICSVTLGAERVFQIKDKDWNKQNFLLEDGSLIYMWSWSQTNRVHSLPKSKTQSWPRINLTFRTII